LHGRPVIDALWRAGLPHRSTLALLSSNPLLPNVVLPSRIALVSNPPQGSGSTCSNCWLRAVEEERGNPGYACRDRLCAGSAGTEFCSRLSLQGKPWRAAVAGANGCCRGNGSCCRCCCRCRSCAEPVTAGDTARRCLPLRKSLQSPVDPDRRNGAADADRRMGLASLGVAVVCRMGVLCPGWCWEDGVEQKEASVNSLLVRRLASSTARNSARRRGSRSRSDRRRRYVSRALWMEAVPNTDGKLERLELKVASCSRATRVSEAVSCNDQ